MILAIKKSKYLKNLVIFGLSFCFFAWIPVFVLVFEAGADDPKTWVVMVLGILLTALFGFLLFHLLRIRKKLNRIMVIENDTFYDYSGAFKYPKIVPLSEIIAVDNYGSGKTNTLKIKRRSASRSGNSFADQLNGSDVYVTDTLVDPKEFENMCAYLQNQVELFKTKNKS